MIILWNNSIDNLKQTKLNNLIKKITEYISVSEQDIDLTGKLFIRKEFHKNDCIHTAGSICKDFFYIEKGIVTHYTSSDDKETVIYFSSENEFVCDFDSFISKKPSKKSFIAIEDTVIYSISYDNLQQFYTKVKEGERFGRLYLESVFAETINHLISVFTESAEKRYLDFLKKFKHIQQRVPQYYIASFIGVTPQSLSRIRRQIAKK